MLATLLRRAGRAEATLSTAAALALFEHDWPRNVRELEHALSAALALTSGRIELEHLPPSLREDDEPPPGDGQPTAGAGELRAQLEALFAEHDGNIAEVARVLGKGRTQIHRWVKRFGIDLERWRGAR
jgi:transcriptional regulator of acetoin/glycerol metabolism